MAKYELRFMFDFGSGVCIQSANDETNRKYGYPISSELLPVTQKLIDELNALIEKHDEALDWSCPQNGLVWGKAEQMRFTENDVKMFNKLCIELGGDYHVELFKDHLI